MNCIDAVEGTAKSMLSRFLDLAIDYRMDASEYIRNVKTVIDGAAQFIKDNPEVSDSPDILRDVLYAYAKSQWLSRMEKTLEADPATATGPDVEYQEYCYDHLYDRGNYPR
jgi:hypothetical protein